MERMYKPRGAYWPRIQVGGYVWMGEDGVLHHKFRSYEPTELQKNGRKANRNSKNGSVVEKRNWWRKD